MPAVLLGVVAAVAWSIHDIFARSLAERVGPYRMALLVMIAGSLLLAIVVGPAGGLAGLTRSGIVLALAMGLGYGLGAASLFKAFSLGPLSVVGPITAAYPVLVVLWGLLTGFVPGPLQWLAIAATMAGAVMVGRLGPEDGGLNAVKPGKLPAMFLCCGLCMFAYAAAVILGQKAAVEIGEIQAALVSRPATLLAILPFLWSEPPPPRLAPRQWLGIAVMSLLDITGLVAVNASGSLPDKEFAAVGISCYGGLATLFAAFILRERVTAGQWLGVALIGAGVGGLTYFG